MKKALFAVLAASLALGQFAISTASAEEVATTSHFRSATPQSFSTTELQQYGLSTADADQVAALQQQGYQVQVMTPEEAQATYGGAWSQNTWIIIGVIALVVIAAAAI